MSDILKTEDDLRGVYLKPGDGAVSKELKFLDKHCKQFISLSPFLCIGTSRDGGMADVSPRGGEPGFVHVLNDTVIAMPDRPGNNRLDTITNLTSNPAVGLLFFIPGFEDLLRVNGTARVSVEPELMERFTVDGKPPRSVMLIDVKEAYLHCTKAIRRSGLWNAEAQVPRDAMPTAGQIYRDHCKVEFPADAIDAGLEADAKENLY